MECAWWWWAVVWSGARRGARHSLSRLAFIAASSAASTATMDEFVLPSVEALSGAFTLDELKVRGMNG
jgi:hypothetical protein